jgi:hypothetical protein
MFALVFGFTLLGVPLIIFVALDPTTIVVTAAFALQLAACLIGVVWILRAFSDDDRPDEPQPHEGEPEILRPPSRPPPRPGSQAPSINPVPLATSGRTSQAEAQIKAPDFVNIERQLQGALQTPVAS